MHCPLDPVQARLSEGHILWHEALGAYHDPPRFRAFLNSLLQSLRNVTFVLQKSKAAIPAFDSWYAVWRERMALDPVMRWLVDARNQVVKQGDLATTSTTHVAIHENYRAGPVLQLEVPPELPMEAIIERVLREDLPEALKRYGVIFVERSWRVQELGNRELLDALGHAFGILTHLVVDAHKQLPLDKAKSEECVKIGYADDHAHTSDWRPFCMVSATTSRSIAVQIESEYGMEAKSTYPKLTPRDEAVSVERYGEWPVREADGAPTIRNVADSFFQQAKVMFLKDGYHSPFAFLFGADGEVSIIELRIPDPGARPVVVRELLRRIEAEKANTVMFIAESWVAPLESLGPGKIPADSAERREVLDLTVVSRVGESFAWACPIIRSQDGLELGATEAHPPMLAMYTEPIIKLWRRWDTETGAAWSHL